MGSQETVRSNLTNTDETSDAAKIEVKNLSKQFDTEDGVERVFDNLNFTVEPSTFVTIIGKSGSGKSTLLNIISGVLEPTKGTVEFETDGNSNVTVGHVFQSPRLLPWNTCLQNIEFVHENNEEYSPALAKKYLDMVGLSDHYDKYPTQLSGGQKQRVGIARAFSIDPEVLIMDEPFSNLDEITATDLRKELINIWQQLNKTILFVTHDINEAIELSDRILMIGGGEIYDDIRVPLERPRSAESEKFLKFREEAINRFHSIDNEM